MITNLKFFSWCNIVKVKTCCQLKHANSIFQLVKRCHHSIFLLSEKMPPHQKMPPHEIKTDIKNNMKNWNCTRFPVVHLHVQSTYHHTATFTSTSQNLTLVLRYLFCTCRPSFSLLNNCIAQFDLLSKMASIEQELQEQEIVFLTWVTKICESDALDIHEVGARLQDFDQVLEVVRIRTGIIFLIVLSTFRSQPRGCQNLILV